MDLNPVYFPQHTNRESWTQIIELADADTGELIDLSGLTSIHLEVRVDRPQYWDASGYGPSYGYGTVDFPTPILTADLGAGITIIGFGTFRLRFSTDQMRTLGPATYAVGCTISDGDDTRQLFLGRLPIMHGMVT